MTRGDARVMLRRMIRDVDKVEWPDDVELNALLNQAYALVQKEVRKHCRDAHLIIDYIDTKVNTSWYPLPQTFGVKRVGLKSAAADVGWAKLAKKDYDYISGAPATAGGAATALSATYYALEGEYIGIFPAPSAIVVKGIELIHHAVLAIDTGSAADGDFFKLKTPLHIGIVWWAKLIALGETDESSGETRTRLSELFTDLGEWYCDQDDTPDRLSVNQ